MRQSWASYLVDLGQDLREILLSRRSLQGGVEGLRSSLSPTLPAPGSPRVLPLASPPSLNVIAPANRDQDSELCPFTEKYLLAK